MYSRYGEKVFLTEGIGLVGAKVESGVRLVCLRISK